MQIHTPTVVQGEVDGTPPLRFFLCTIPCSRTYADMYI